MRKRVSDNVWIPFWVDKWIFGSMRIEFSLEERAIWIDLLALASKDDGYIRANEETPYPIQQLAGMLLIPNSILKSAIEKFIKKRKLTRLKNGTLYITNWEKYQLSERQKRRYESKKADTMAEKADTKSNQIKSNQIKTKHLEKYSEIIFNFEKQQWENITNKDRERWEKTYPACDIEFELNKMADWLISNPNKKKKKYRAFISRWLSRVQESGGTKGIKPAQKEMDELLAKLESKNEGKND